jgi:hypothetical protein
MVRFFAAFLVRLWLRSNFGCGVLSIFRRASSKERGRKRNRFGVCYSCHDLLLLPENAARLGNVGLRRFFPGDVARHRCQSLHERLIIVNRQLY